MTFHYMRLTHIHIAATFGPSRHRHRGTSPMRPPSSGNTIFPPPVHPCPLLPPLIRPPWLGSMFATSLSPAKDNSLPNRGSSGSSCSSGVAEIPRSTSRNSNSTGSLSISIALEPRLRANTRTRIRATVQGMGLVGMDTTARRETLLQLLKMTMSVSLQASQSTRLVALGGGGAGDGPERVSPSRPT